QRLTHLARMDLLSPHPSHYMTANGKQDSMSEPQGWHGTTILSLRKGNRVVVAGDGQVSIGQTIIKSNARKVRHLAGGNVIGGFAGATADAITLFERLGSEIDKDTAQLNPRPQQAP